ncbi:MAG: GTP-binding protein LepA [Parcubacteria group bacterium Licking1014_17]|nr:MAG: GTP-binding protein LepA [Parcubacteria group bacterium Licking1014_17]
MELTGTIEKRAMHAQYLDSMELERERGITIKLQPVRMRYSTGTEGYILNLIDTPGHVDFSYEVSRSLAAVEGAILLVDATKGVQAQTLANYSHAKKQGLVIIPVINKIDLVNVRVKEVEEEINVLTGIESKDILRISAKSGEGVEKVLQEVIEKVPPPRESEIKTFRALIFDSVFDKFKGVIAYARVFDGSLKAGNTIKLVSSRAGGEVIEVGYFAPELRKDSEIKAGDIGYIATGLKNVGQVRVGDTIAGDFNENERASLALPGYKEPKPMVFASFYPENSESYDGLRDALGKLKLTDASLTYEPESSPALGRGFRLGFLGMLHVEIVSERLRREFDLSLIISTPSVEYHVITNNGEAVKIRSASLIPDPNLIKKIEEPMIKLKLLSPSSYLGALMNLMSEIRSRYIATSYLGHEVIILEYRVPLSEIITEFYDKLKSISSGYASMDYEEDGWEEANLVRLDILIAGERVEPFSRVVPEKNAYDEGRRIVEKLKKILPRQLFAVSVQAAIGGKIVARETLSAMRKDVTGYLYGGDITRKKKLLEKQKKGKKRMKESGKVNIPHSVFIQMLKK